MTNTTGVTDESAEPDFGRAVCPNCKYWRREAERAIEKRARLDKLLDSVDGGAGYWRQTSRMLTERLQRYLPALRTMKTDTLRGHYLSTLDDYGRVLSRLIDLENTTAALKSQLWDAWTALDNAVPQRETIRKVWEQL